MITITDDYGYVRDVITHPSIWPWVSDDGTCDVSEFYPNDSHAYLKVVDGCDMGLFSIRHVNSTTCEIHTALLPCAKGSTRKYGAEVLRWLAENSGYRKVITFVPENNEKAKRLAIDSGFSVEGLSPDSWVKNGVSMGQHILGVSLCQQQQS